MNWSTHEFIWLDWVVFAIGIACVVGAVWHALLKAKRESKGANSEEFLYGKGEPWWVIGMAIFAANIGSEHLVGLAGTGAQNGVGMAHWEMQGWMILILGWLFVPFYQLLNNKLGRIITMPGVPQIPLHQAHRYMALCHHPCGLHPDKGLCDGLHRWYLL